MRGKRSKQYRKLMQQYGLTFGFREPYQVLLDAAILQDAARFKMDFVGGLQKCLHGEIKPLITQCSMRHLYTAEPKDEVVIDHAKAFERRRCGHHTLDKPLSTMECFASVIDPKSSHTNKNRYVVATQDPKIRAYLRTIPGVPVIYIKRSVMIMEPMGGATERVKEREEKAKFKAGIIGSRTTGTGQKRKRDDEEVSGADDSDEDGSLGATENQTNTKLVKPKRRNGPKEPNPLSMKKAKKATAGEARQLVTKPEKSTSVISGEPGKRRRMRKHKKEGDQVQANEPTAITTDGT